MTSREKFGKDRREHSQEKTPRFEELFLDWHEGLARVGVEQQIVFGQIKPDVLQRQLLRRTSDHAKIDFGIPIPLWKSDQMIEKRQAIADVYTKADAFYKSPGINYQSRGKVRKGENGELEDDTYNEHGARASFFALKYLGVTDPTIHAMLRFHDIGNFFDDEATAKETLSKHLRELVQEGVLPSGIFDLILDLNKSDRRTTAAAKRVQADKGIPSEFHQGTEHTPQSLWNLYKMTTTRYSSHSPDTNNSYLSPVALFGNTSETTADEYRKHVARLALAYEKFTHPKKDTSPQKIQEDALMVLMELWPIVRGLDEGILSRYAGDCIARAFMPQAFDNLGNVVADTFPANKLEKQRAEHAQWFLSHIAQNVGPTVAFVTPLQMLKREYAKLSDREFKQGAFDVAVPGVVTKLADGRLIDPHVIDVKTRSSVFWKMLERWNDQARKKALPKEAQKLVFGSVEFWQWALSCHHDIFRSQIIFLGDVFARENVQAFAETLRNEVLSDLNKAVIMYPSERNSELFEIKSGKGIRVNLIYRPEGGVGNVEVQIKDAKAYDETVLGEGRLDHIAYKLRHQIQFLDLRTPQIGAIVKGGHEMRKRHLEMTYMFLEGGTQSGEAQGGTIYRRNNRR